MPGQQDLAGPAVRVVAGLVDGLIVYLALLPIAIAIAVVRPVRETMTVSVQNLVGWVTMVLSIGVSSTAFWLFPVATGRRTLGQCLTSVYSVRFPSREPIGFVRGYLLLVLSLISSPLILVLALVEFMNCSSSLKKRLWYDRLTGTAVLLGSRKDSLSARCETCGYDLRGSLKSDRCPECGMIFDRQRVETWLSQQGSEGQQDDPGQSRIA